MFKYLQMKVFGNLAKRDQVLTTYEDIEGMLSNFVIPSIDEVLNNTPEINDKELKELVEVIGKRIGKQKDVVGVLTFMKSVFSDILDNGNTIKDLILDMDDYISKKEMTPKIASIIGYIENVGIMATYSMDFMLLTLYKGTNEVYIIKAKEKFIEEAGRDFAFLLESYKDIGGILDKMEKLSDTVVITDNDLLEKGSNNDKSFSVPVTKFIGNPIFHLRVWFVDAEVKVIDIMENKKKLLELKLLELRSGERNAKIDKQAEAYEESISKFESWIQKLKDW